LAQKEGWRRWAGRVRQQRPETEQERAKPREIEARQRRQEFALITQLWDVFVAARQNERCRMDYSTRSTSLFAAAKDDYGVN
jgi:hypothetical protein